MKTSDSTASIAAALAAVQGEIKNPEVNKTVKVTMKAGGVYSYRYADLPNVYDATRAALSKHSIAHWSTIEVRPEGLILTYRLTHKSGEWVESEMLISASSDPKVLAGDLTYFRRYLFNGLIGIAGDDDIDDQPQGMGKATPKLESKPNREAAPSAATPAAQPSSEKPRDPNIISDVQLKRLFALQKVAEMPDAVMKEIANGLGITTRSAIPKEKYETLCHLVETWSVNKQ